MRSRTIRLVTSSGTVARVHGLAASIPSGVPFETLARRCRPWRSRGSRSGDVLGLGALAGPRRAHDDQSHQREESFVVALLELALDLLHGVERDTHHDQDRGAAEREVLVRVDDDDAISGISEIRPRYSAPGNVMRDRT